MLKLTRQWPRLFLSAYSVHTDTLTERSSRTGPAQLETFQGRGILLFDGGGGGEGTITGSGGGGGGDGGGGDGEGGGGESGSGGGDSGSDKNHNACQHWIFWHLEDARLEQCLLMGHRALTVVLIKCIKKMRFRVEFGKEMAWQQNTLRVVCTDNPTT